MNAVFARLCLVLLVFSLGASRAAAQEVIEYYGTDALGSVRVVFAPDGTVKARSDYLPFGEEYGTTTPGGPLPTQRFTGQQRDAEEGHDNFNARSYQTRTGRFTTVDPIFAGLFEPQNLNRYAYVRNRPANLTDPTGMWGTCGPGCFTTRNEEVYDFWGAGNLRGSGAVSAYHEDDQWRNQWDHMMNMALWEHALNRLLDLIPSTEGVGGPESELVPTQTDNEFGRGTDLAIDGTFLLLGALIPGDNGEKKLAGKLGKDILDTFDGKVREVTLKKDVTAIRYWGNQANERGRFLTTRQTNNMINSPESAQSVLALHPSWGNSAESMTQWVIPQGTTIYMGRIQGGAAGATQIFVPDMNVLVKR
jgi:RHS repeat-associated protein